MRQVDGAPPATRTATTPIRCAAIRCSSWLSIGCPRAQICARNQRSPGWKTCPICGHCCALAGRWSSSIAARSERCRNASCSMSTTPRFREGRLFDRVHGAQQLRLFNAYHDDYGFQPIVVFDEGRFVTAVLRPGKRPSGVEIGGLFAVSSAPSGLIGPRSRSCCAPTVIMRPPKCSTGTGQTASIGCLAWPPTAVHEATEIDRCYAFQPHSEPIRPFLHLLLPIQGTPDDLSPCITSH
jgi:Transposase DDE domain group 1